MLIPWGVYWRNRLWGVAWVYSKLWSNHYFIVVLAVLGLIFLCHLAAHC